jgi:NAD(P)-dependent dehydrogenase (short-subunit alcohol dehydrogenase family)
VRGGVIAREASGREGPLLATADLARREEAFGVVDATLARWGRIDVLVNNAGWGKLAPIAETGEELMRTTFAINFFAAANLIQRAWPAFLKQRSATVVNVSSWAAHDPFPGFFAYAASKAALESLARSIANDVEKLGLPDIRAYSVAPGAVETPLLRAVFSEEALPRAATLEPEVIAARILDCVQGRAGVKNGGSILVRSPG